MLLIQTRRDYKTISRLSDGHPKGKRKMPSVDLPRAISMLTTSLVLAFSSTAARAQIHFDIHAQTMASALVKVGNIAKVNVIFDAKVVEGLWASPINEETSAEGALAHLLSGTGLHIQHVGARTIIIRGATDSNDARDYYASSIRLEYEAVGSNMMNDAASDGESASAASREASDGSEGRTLAEVLVTAQKREEKLQD